MSELDDLQEQLPPQNIEAEQAVLGAIFLNNDSLLTAIEYLHVDDFYRHAHQLIFKAMLDLNDQGSIVDAVTVNDLLSKENKLDDVGGSSYIVELAESVPTASNIVHYAKIVQNNSILRKLIQTASNITEKAFNSEKDVDELLADAETEIMNISEHRETGNFKAIKDVLNDAMSDINMLSQKGDDITGLATGFHELDKLTTGLHDDELTIIAARPGVGKTAFALNIAKNVAVKSKKTVAILVWKWEQSH